MGKAELYYHIIITPYKRRNMSINALAALPNLITISCQEHDVELLEIKCLTDHSHLLIKAKITTNLPSLLQSIKGKSSRLINKINGTSGKIWSAGYFIKTVGSSGVGSTKRYIQNNKED